MTYLTRIIAFMKLHKWKCIIAAVVLLPIIALVTFVLKPTQPTFITEKAVRGDLIQSVEAVGTVISDNDLALQFPSTGIVAFVHVKEGDLVKAGRILATLRSGNLAADIASARARVMGAQANLDALQQGNRLEDIEISQADVQNKRSSLISAQASLQNAKTSLISSQTNLDALTQELSVSLAGSIGNIGGSVQQKLTTTDIALSSVQDIFSQNDVADALIKYGTSDADLLRASMNTTQAAIWNLSKSLNPVLYEDAIILLDKARATLQSASNQIDQTYTLIGRLPVSTYFTESSRTTYKDQISAQRSLMQSALSTLDATSKSLRDASANYSTRITQEKTSLAAAEGARDKALADIATFQAALQISEAQLKLKLAPPRKTDVSAAMANLQQAYAALAGASANYQNTVLVAPIDGTVTKVNIKVGEISPIGPSVTMLGASPYRIEMHVSEIDIPKVHVTQSGSIELDAFRGTHFQLHVSEIDSTPTNQQGVNKYRVRLDFRYPHDELKVGMTGDAEINTGIRKDVVSVPLRSVIQSDLGMKIVRVMNDSSVVEEREVVTGLEGTNGYVEIISGVSEGETVVVLVKK
jgi:RND family efflux transporter MFP subunit